MSDDEPKIEVITRAEFACEFGPGGFCIAHGKSIMDHDAILTREVMTLEEAKRRFPDTAPDVWDRLDKS